MPEIVVIDANDDCHKGETGDERHQYLTSNGSRKGHVLLSHITEFESTLPLIHSENVLQKFQKLIFIIGAVETGDKWVILKEECIDNIQKHLIVTSSKTLQSLQLRMPMKL